MPRTPVAPAAISKRAPEWEGKVEGQRVDVFRRVADIDLDDLSTEVRQAGGNALWLAILAARARREQRQVEMRRDVVRAETAQRIRAEQNLPSNVGRPKLTEAGVSEQLTLDKHVQEAEQDLIEAELRVNVLRGAQTAAEQKQRTLGSLSLLLLKEQQALTGAYDQAVKDVVRERLRGEPRAGRR